MEILVATLVSNLVILGFEYWLGKTDKVVANSTVEALANSAGEVAKVFVKK